MKEYTLLIGGQAVAGDATMDVINPATGKVLAQCPRASVEQANAAVAAARNAFPVWSATPLAERRAALNRLADAMEANIQDLARQLTLEQGKPLKDATEEIGGAAFLAELSERVPSAANVAQYARIVKDKAVLRSLILNLLSPLCKNSTVGSIS